LAGASTSGIAHGCRASAGVFRVAHATTTQNTPIGEQRQQRAAPCHEPAFGDTYRTMKTSFVFALGLVVVGCGDGGGSSGTPVVINAAGTRLAAINDGTMWKPLTLDAQGKASPVLDGPTLIATVCDDPQFDFMNYYTVGVGPGGGEVDMYCGEVKPSSRITIVAPVSTLVFASFSRATGGDSMTIPNGTYDIVALDTTLTPPRIEVRRAVDVTANTTLTFDLATTGTPMPKVHVDVTGAEASELVSQRVSFTVGSKQQPTFSTWLVSASEAFTVPAALLRAADRHVVHASVSSDTSGSRQATRDITGNETVVSLALPTFITSATVAFGGMPSVTWQGDARFDQLYFGINSEDFSELWDIALYPSWTAAGGDLNAVTIPDPHEIPGWTPAWEFTSTVGLEWFLSVSHDAAPDHISAARTGSL
jgi:hypothetical protein